MPMTAMLGVNSGSRDTQTITSMQQHNSEQSLNDSSGDNYLAAAERADRDRNVSNVSGLSALSHKSAPERERSTDMHTHQHHHIDAGFRPDRDVVSDLRDIERERERSDRVTSTLSMLSMASSGSLTRGATPPLVGSSGGVALGLA
eukprot:8559-Heterococcus_DN1.PRE.1